jgi:hypothetical protein
MRIHERGGLAKPAKKPGDLWTKSRTLRRPGPNLSTVATKYYTHFVTGSSAPAAASANEWSGVVELRHPLENVRGTRELRSLLAQSFDLDSDDIKILHWARLH